MKITVNGAKHEVNVSPNMPLLWVLRETLGLTGTKFGCGKGFCGACTVHLDGVAVRSCSVPVSDVSDRQIVTIEGLSPNGNHPLQQIWKEIDVPDCGYCQMGQIMAADTRAMHDTAALLDLREVERAAVAIASAPRVNIFGASGSALVGEEMQFSLHRIGVAAWAWTDVHNGLASAALSRQRFSMFRW